MDSLLCDELLQEIFQKLPPSSSSSSSISLVSKRWLHLHRTSTTSLSLRLSSPLLFPSLSSLLSHYPFLSSLSLLSSDPTATSTTHYSDHLLLLVSTFCSNLLSLRCLAGPVSLSSLLSLSTTCNHVTSLCFNLSRPLTFRWVVSFHSLKELSVFICSLDDFNSDTESQILETDDDEFDSESSLSLESLCLSGLRVDDSGLGWLYRRCKKLKKLQLKSCESVGDIAAFIKCLNSLQEIELRTCRSIVDMVLLKLAENCCSLTSLLLYDGGSKEGLLRFITQSTCNLRKLDLRLPLDLNNDHLLAMAMNFRTLQTLRLQSCCLVTGEGLKALGVAMSRELKELALINCDVVEQDPGLLSTLGQSLRKLRILDLSYNEMLADKEFVSMLVSCDSLVELKLRGCRRLTNTALISMSKKCKRLKFVDIMYCSGIETSEVESLLVNLDRLSRVEVEEGKVSDAAKMIASKRFIQLVG